MRSAILKYGAQCVLAYAAVMSVADPLFELLGRGRFHAVDAYYALGIGFGLGLLCGRRLPQLIPTGLWTWSAPVVAMLVALALKPERTDLFNPNPENQGLAFALLTLPSCSNAGYSLGMLIASMWGVRPSEAVYRVSARLSKPAPPPLDAGVSGPLAPLLVERAAWLFTTFDFKVVASEHEHLVFGNAEVLLSSPKLRLRFERDRGQVSVELNPPREPGVWYDLFSVCGVIHGREPVCSGKLDTVLPLLRDNLAALAEALGPRLAQTRQRIRKPPRRDARPVRFSS